MFCPKCGAQNPDGAAFCKGCGDALGGTIASTPGRATTSGKKTFAIIGGVVALVVIAIVVFAVSTCSGSSGKLTPGIYQLSRSDYDGSMKVVLNEDGTGTLSQSGYDETLSGTYEQIGAQDGSIVYGLSNIRSSDGAYIDENGIVYDEDGAPQDDVLESCQFMVPSGGTSGQIAGLWGVLYDMKKSDGTHNTAVYFAEVKDDGTGMIYSKTSYGTLEAPTFDLNAMMDTGAQEDSYINSEPFTWEEGGEGAYKVTNQYGDSFNIMMPVAK